MNAVNPCFAKLNLVQFPGGIDPSLHTFDADPKLLRHRMLILVGSLVINRFSFAFSNTDWASFRSIFPASSKPKHDNQRRCFAVDVTDIWAF